MKIFLQRCLPALCLPLILVACEASQPTVTYYLEHPRQLDKQLQNCMMKTEAQMAASAKCKTAIDAQGLLRVYLLAEQRDPEQFGQRILNTEIECADLKGKIGETWQASEALRKDYADKQQELRILLAVAGLNSPE